MKDAAITIVVTHSALRKIDKARLFLLGRKLQELTDLLKPQRRNKPTEK